MLLNTKNTLLSQVRRLTLVLISNQITKSCNTPSLRHMATVRIVLPHNRQTAQSPKAGRYFLCYIDGLRKNIYTIQGDIISAHPRPVILCDVLFPDFITFLRYHGVNWLSKSYRRWTEMIWVAHWRSQEKEEGVPKLSFQQNHPCHT